MVRSVAALLFAALAGTSLTGQTGAPPAPVGATSRRVQPPRDYPWRGASTRALAATIWYPAAAGAPMSEHDIGPAAAPLFRLGAWSDEAPVAAGRFPLILLSHGTGGSAEIMSWLGRRLAARGFIVAAVNHPGNNALEPYTAEGFLLWWERAKDLSALLDFVQRDASMAAAIDPARIGAIGFSLGGYTMFELAGARTDPARLRTYCQSPGAQGCEDPPEFPNLFARWDELQRTSAAFRDALARAGDSYRDARVRAVVAIAPAVAQALIPDTVRQLALPVALIAGQADRHVPLDPNPRYLASLNPRFTLTVLPGAGHYTFLGVCTEAGRGAQPQICLDDPGVDRAAVHDRTAALAAEFFERTLR